MLEAAGCCCTRCLLHAREVLPDPQDRPEKIPCKQHVVYNNSLEKLVHTNIRATFRNMHL